MPVIKPGRVQHKMLVPYLNGVQGNRVQSIGISTTLDTEDITELGTALNVEMIDAPPAIEITIEAIEHTGVELLNAILGIPGNNAVFENKGHITNQACQITIPIRDEQDVLNRVMYVGPCHLNRIDLNYSIGGNATESYGLSSDSKRWFANNTFAFGESLFASNGTQTTIQTLYTPTVSSGGNQLINLTIDGVTQIEGTHFSVSGKTITLNSALSSGNSVTWGYATTNTIPFYTVTPATTYPVTRHGHVEIYLSDDLTNKVLRLQTVSISMDATRDTIQQLGEFKAYARYVQLPIPVTITAEALDSDLEIFARLCSLNYKTNTEINIDNFIKNMSLRVDIYKNRSDKRASGETPVKRITVGDGDATSLVPSAENYNIAVGGNAVQTFNWKADYMKIEKIA